MSLHRVKAFMAEFGSFQFFVVLYMQTHSTRVIEKESKYFTFCMTCSRILSLSSSISIKIAFTSIQVPTR